MVDLSESYKNQIRKIAEQCAPWLELFDTDLAEQDVPVDQRPLKALIMLLREGAIVINAGKETIDVSKPQEHLRAEWFRSLYAAVEYWYIERFGKATVTTTGNSPLMGAVLIKGVAFELRVPAQRHKVEVEGETSWFYFDETVANDEDVLSWIVNCPDISQYDSDALDSCMTNPREIATMLRFIRYRSGAGDFNSDREAWKLGDSGFAYLNQAARRIANGQPSERGMTWFDLQMANESALKAVIRRATGNQPHIHLLKELLAQAKSHGVIFDAANLDNWPSFTNISEWRYGQGDPPGLEKLFAAYLTSLQLIWACMSVIPPVVPAGFRILLEYAPWKHRPVTSSAADGSNSKPHSG